MLRTEIQLYHGPRSNIRSLFEDADDAPTQIDTYIDLGEVLVACCRQQIVGHVQLVAVGTEWEIKSLAVIDGERRKGIGTALVLAALTRACGAGADRVVVATATADIDNLRFYQRVGFRMDRVERDAFTAENGYPDLEVHGIPVRDRVWFSFSCADADAESDGLLRRGQCRR